MSDKAFTHKTAENAKPGEKPYKLSTGRGFYLLVMPTGGKLWRYDYRLNGKRKTAALGSFPDVSLKDAAEKQAACRKLIEQGIDPVAEKSRGKREAEQAAKPSAPTFRAVAQEWLKIKKDEWAASNLKKKEWLLSLLYKGMGDKSVSEIAPADILAVLRLVEADGHNVTARKLAETAGQVCRYARTCGYALFNPADGLKEILRPVQTTHHASLTNPAEVGFLLRCIDEYQGGLSMIYALKILPYLALRSTELRGARWEEIDLDNALWVVPASRKDRAKDGGGMKTRVAHEVPLPRQVVELFRTLKKYQEPGPLCFPGRQSATQPISDMGLLNALRRMGFAKGQMTVHGFRGTFSTLLNERKLEWGFDGDIIEAQLAHKEGDKVRVAYNHASYLEQRRALLQRWADYLDELRDSAGRSVARGRI